MEAVKKDKTKFDEFIDEVVQSGKSAYELENRGQVRLPHRVKLSSDRLICLPAQRDEYHAMPGSSSTSDASQK